MDTTRQAIPTHAPTQATTQASTQATTQSTTQALYETYGQHTAQQGIPHSLSQPLGNTQNDMSTKSTMFKFPKLIYSFENRGDGRDSHNLYFDPQTIFICSILSLAWAGLILSYGMGITATMGVSSIPSFVYACLAMLVIFPVSMIWGGFFVYHYTHQSYKASNEILEAARILGSPALIATEDVKTLSSAVGHELNCLRSSMRDVEEQMNGISKRIESEIHTLNESSDKLHQTLSDVSGTIRVERDAIVDLMQIIKKENDNALRMIAERNKTHIQVSTMPQYDTDFEHSHISTPQEIPNQVGELHGGEITYVHDLRTSVAQPQNPVMTEQVTHPAPPQPQSDIQSEENVRKPVQFSTEAIHQTQTGGYVQKPEAIILRRERQLYEGVCALTVDLNRELGITLPQDLWSRYMRGERHVFADYLFEKLDNNFSHYQSLLESEAVRKLCNQFIARFETLRERLFDEPDVAVSEYLENSGVGRIYTILSVEYV